MDKQEIYGDFYRQIANDYSCSVDEVRDFDNHIQINTHPVGRRLLKPQNYLAKIISLNGKYILEVDEMIYEEICEKLAKKSSSCEQSFAESSSKEQSSAEHGFSYIAMTTEPPATLMAEWASMGQFSNLISEITSKYGYEIKDQHHFYLPTGCNWISPDEMEEMKAKYTLKWYEKDDLEIFRGDSRFTAALSFVDSAPDMICLTAEKDGVILGMSGVSADSDIMWQIGIDVLKEARGQNLGPFLTILMKEEVLRRGKLPFYGTAESHIQSQKVGLKSGFFPAWYEAYWYK